MCMVGSKMSQRREIERENEIVGHRERERGGGGGGLQKQTYSGLHT